METALRRAGRSAPLPRGSRVLVAVSGGADSVALLAGLVRLRRELGVTVTAAHLHHGLRGADADADLAHVRALCAALDVPLIAARWDTRRRMAARRLAGQDGLRTLRREFLRRAARRAGAAAIATAHTADDQLETLLMRLARGTGLRGLAGMRERRGRWLKPLLAVTRAEIEADLAAAGLGWREDRSNASPRYLRSRLRHQAIPALVAALAPERDPGAVRAALARHAAAAAREADEALAALGEWTRPLRPRISRIQPATLALDPAEMASYPIAARRIVLATLWQRLPRGLPGLTRRHLDSLDRLTVHGRPGSQVALPGGWVARRGPRMLHIQRRHASHRETR